MVEMRVRLVERESDIGGRTMQILPREAQVTGQDWRTKNYSLQRVNVIISLHWVGKIGHKIHKKSPHLGATYTGQCKMILMVQIVQQLHQTTHQKGI